MKLKFFLKYQANVLTKDQLLRLSQATAALSNQTQSKVIGALSVTPRDVTKQRPTNDVIIRRGLASVRGNRPQVNAALSFGTEAQKNTSSVSRQRSEKSSLAARIVQAWVSINF